MLGNDDDDNNDYFIREESVYANDNTNFITNHANADPLWMWSVAVADDDVNDDLEN